MSEIQGKVYFVGSGPGDPELVTIKAKRIISEADVVVYADSLVPPEIAGFASPDAEVHGSKAMALPEIMDIMLEAVASGKTVARVQSGDPSVYGAILEQMRILEREGVDYEIVPGVSAAFAAAAVLKTELTVPGGVADHHHDPCRGPGVHAAEGTAAGPGSPRLHSHHLPQHHAYDQNRQGAHGRWVPAGNPGRGGVPGWLARREGDPWHSL